VLELICTNEGMAQHFFKYNPDEKIDSKQVIKIMKPDFSPNGHHRRQSQEIVMAKFIAFLKSMEGVCLVTKSRHCETSCKRGGMLHVAKSRTFFHLMQSNLQLTTCDLQHGFRRKRSCTTQLLRVFHDVGMALDSGKEADMIYLDFSKAFDSVSHPKLLFKLEQHGISGTLLKWFTDYLNVRRQRVVVDGILSSFLYATSGVPQGREYTWTSSIVDLCKRSSERS
jgi:hypothetical protein